MVWYAWVMVGLIGFNILANIYSIGKPREPITPLAAVLVLIIDALFIFGVVSLAT